MLERARRASAHPIYGTRPARPVGEADDRAVISLALTRSPARQGVRPSLWFGYFFPPSRSSTVLAAPDVASLATAF